MSPRMVPFVVVLLLAAMLAPPASADDVVDPLRPVAAVAVGSGSTAIVAWVEGVGEEDYFRVYGVRNDSFSFLTVAEADATFAEVDAGFPQYAVTAVRDDVESEPAFAALGVGIVCVTVEPGIPPGFGIDHSCTARVGTKVAMMRATY